MSIEHDDSFQFTTIHKQSIPTDTGLERQSAKQCFSPALVSPIFHRPSFRQSPGATCTIPTQLPPRYLYETADDAGAALPSVRDIEPIELEETRVEHSRSNRMSPGGYESSISNQTRSSVSQILKNDGHRRPYPLIRTILLTLLQSLNTWDRILLILGFICAFLQAAATPTFSFLFSRLLSTYFHPEDSAQKALKWSLSILGVSVINAIASYSMHYLLERSGQAWVDELRRVALRGILHQPRKWFEKDENSASKLTLCLDGDAEEMRNLVGRFAGFIFIAIVIMVIGITWCLVLSWKFALVGVACAPALYAVTRTFERISGKWEARCHDAGETIGGIFSETFMDIHTVQTLTLESYFLKKHYAANSEALVLGFKRAWYSGIFFGLSNSSLTFVFCKL